MMTTAWKHKFQLYKHFQVSAPAIYAECKAAARDIGLTDELKGSIGGTGAVSNCHGLLTDRVSSAMEAGARKVINSATLDEQIRELVKNHYGDEWDAACVNTCEAGLWVTIDALFTPPFTGRGSNYRARYIAPYERHLHHQGGYGRPFPPRFKDLFADRGSTAGEMGFYGKRQADLDALYVRLAGARYECHGIKYHPCPLLADVDPKESLRGIEQVAERHAPLLTGIVSLGYDTPGYGYGRHDEQGTPLLQKGLAELAGRYGIPYVVDNAFGVPFLGIDPRRSGADIVLYSMDKAAGAPTAGLIIGREEPMVAIRRALGIHGDRWGTGSSHGKAAYVTNDPGKEALLGVIAALQALQQDRAVILETLSRFEAIVREVVEELPSALRDVLVVTKSANSQMVEVNYERSWTDGRLGIPIFGIEDMYAGTQIQQVAMSQMGLVPAVFYDGNILMSPGLGTTAADGSLLERETRVVVRAVFRVLEIVARHAKFID